MADSASIIAASQATAGVARAYGQVQSGRFNASVDRFNARVADMQAKDALRRGDEAVDKHRTDVRRLKGAQRAALAAQGVVLDVGTAADLLEDTDIQAAKDEETIRVNAAMEAWGFRVQAVDHRARARVETYTARNNAAGTLLSTTARFADAGSRAGTYNPALPVY